MVDKLILTWWDVRRKVRVLAELLKGQMVEYVYGIPTGGAIVAGLLSEVGFEVIHELPEVVEDRIAVVDDLIDSGSTMKPYFDLGWKCFALYSKAHSPVSILEYDGDGVTVVDTGTWLVFPWEPFDGEVAGPHDAVRRLLEYLGENPNREGLQETPDRVIRSYSELFSGYAWKPEDVLKVFSSEKYDQIVLSRNIQVFSMCEHHMLPFIGKAHVAYIPNGTDVIGLSKLSRLVDIYARRLQIQERLTDQIAEALMTILKPQAAACVIEAQHLCMAMRGVNKQNSTMVTSSMKGKFLDDARARNELMGLIKL